MTRFARAKGSKASNERLPEDSTSWAEMKEQLQRKQKESAQEEQRREIIAKREESYKKFLKEEQRKDEEKKVEWADFSDLQMIQSFKKKAAEKKNIDNLIANNNTFSEEGDGDGSLKKKKKRKNAAKRKLEGEGDDEANKKQKIDEGHSGENNENNPAEVQKKRKTYKLPEQIPYEELSEAEKLKVQKKKARRARQLEKRKLFKEKNAVDDTQKETDGNTQEGKKKKNKKNKANSVNEGQHQSGDDGKKKNKKKNVTPQKKKIPYEELPEAEKWKIDRNREKLARQLEKRKKFKELKKAENEENNSNSNLNESNYSLNGGVNNNKKAYGNNRNNEKNDNRINEKNDNNRYNEKNDNNKNNEKSDNNKNEEKNDNNKNKENGKLNKKSKVREGKEPKRKKPLPQVEKIQINGKPTEITYMHGFPILKEDAENLTELEKSLVEKGLPRSEIDAAMKLARRRAEKNLSRKKRSVCFKCRQSGHVLSECPEIAQEENQIGSGVCFKCGSTEHTHFQCRVVRNQEFKFATCFICKEQGHISKQCPDNARGLYPKGGACKLCGDVTHFKKDCPKRLEEMEGKNFTLDRIGQDVEGLGIDEGAVSNNKISTEKKRTNKIIKF